MSLKEEIQLEPDPVWTDKFETESDRVTAASGEGLLGVFHVGSTAIPDVPGKPALDVLAVYEDSDSMAAAASRLAEEDFELTRQSAEATLLIRWEGESAVFVKMHCPDDQKVRNQLLFTEYLCDHPEARREYEAVKRRAAENHPEDPQAYTEAKADVVQSLLEDARAAGYADRLPEFA